ncbi:MAG TPA: DNA mismatch repair protein MutS [Bauldia sp.]|nr:DNA mismatch repair protein MutS [Bauldia sp.]
MKAHLLAPDGDFDPDQKLPANAGDLVNDLELNVILDTMAREDGLIRDVAAKTLLNGEIALDRIAYRQDILRDCLANAATIRELYALAGGALEKNRKRWRTFFDYPGGRLTNAVEALELFSGELRRLRAIVDRDSARFRSAGLSAFCRTIKAELDEPFFASVSAHLAELQFRHGVLVSARLGPGNKGVSYVLRKPNVDTRAWFARLFGDGTPHFTWYLQPRDEQGARALSDLRDKGVMLVANALQQSTDHIVSFLTALRAELAFYVGCLNLHDTLAELGEPTAFAEPTPFDRRAFECHGLCDVALALTLKRKIVGNDIAAGGARLVVVTGANQGGKSTFLRSVGQAQLMMQAGMFVAAEAFRADVRAGVFTHYKREEDSSMRSGKFDEELARMNALVDGIRPHALMLFNESFASTNEREGSEIGRQIVTALVEDDVKTFFVTHMYELAHDFEGRPPGEVYFLRAQRQEGGERSFHLEPAPPERTSYGEDLYAAIFERGDAPGPGATVRSGATLSPLPPAQGA